MITIQDMITRFGEQEMAERSNHENYETIDEAVMVAAIADAEEEAASYLRAAKLFFTNEHRAAGFENQSLRHRPLLPLRRRCNGVLSKSVISRQSLG